jgi:DNA-binding MarR family transcriptional regulator
MDSFREPDPSIEQCVYMRKMCACFNLRRAARSVTQHFNNAFAGTGVTATQFTALSVLRALGPTPVAQLADAIVVEPSTLSRNLSVLVKNGLVVLVAGKDRRQRAVSLTRAGRDALTRAYPVWVEAQRQIEASFQDGEFHGALTLVRKMAGGAVKAEPKTISGEKARRRRSARPVAA